MKRLLTLFILVSFWAQGQETRLQETDISTITPIACSECDYVLENGSLTSTGGAFDGTDVQPGEIIGLKGDVGSIRFNNLLGTASDPILIRNCDGVATLTGGTNALIFLNSKNFKLLGDYPEYGIVANGAVSSYIEARTFTSDFEMAGILVAGTGQAASEGYAGFNLKTDYTEDCALFDKQFAWSMDNIYIHHNKVDNTRGEAMYIGQGLYDGTSNPCGTNTRTWPHTIRNLRVHHNEITNIGLDGMQIKCADSAILVYDNYISTFGLNGNGAHDEGLYIGEGTTGEIFNNIVLNPASDKSPTSMKVNGLGDFKIYNNVVEGKFESVNDIQKGARSPTGFWYIYHNWFKQFSWQNDIGGIRILKNNIIENDFNPAGVWDMSHNVNDSLSAIDAGVDVGIFTDINGNPRPSNAFDAGPYEDVDLDKENQTMTFDDIGVLTFGDTDFTLSATASSGLEIAFTSSDENVISISEVTASIVGAGSTTITATQLGNESFNAVSTSQEVTVNKANQTITFEAIPDFNLSGDQPFQLMATSTSGLTVSFSVTGPASVEDGILVPEGTGTVTVTAIQEGNANYNPGEPVSQSFEVTSSPLSIGGNDIDVKILVYPNPGTFNAKIDNVQIGSQITIMDMSGRSLWQGRYQEQGIALQAFDNGQYILRISSKKKIVHTRLLISR